MSADGVPIEEIARLAGHNRTATTELVYRHELRPVITTGAEVMDRILVVVSRSCGISVGLVEAPDWLGRPDTGYPGTATSGS